MFANEVLDGFKNGKVITTSLLANEKDIQRFRGLIKQAEKFVFADKELEDAKVTREEMEWIVSGLIPLPAPVCWFEINIQGRDTGFLLYEQEGKLIVDSIDRRKDKVMIYANTQVSVALDGTVDHLDVNVPNRLSQDKQLDMDGYIEASVLETGMAYYLLLMINSRSTEVTVSKPTSRVKTKMAVSRGKSPPFNHRTVVIQPKQYYTTMDSVSDPHDPVVNHRRLHWVRSHIRHYETATPHSKWMEGVEYKGKKGWWVCVIPRCLKGKADLGKLTHDYFVK